jgi:hypothetical protein
MIDAQKDCQIARTERNSGMPFEFMSILLSLVGMIESDEMETNALLEPKPLYLLLCCTSQFFVCMKQFGLIAEGNQSVVPEKVSRKIMGNNNA